MTTMPTPPPTAEGGKSGQALPSPAERPVAEVVIFDGHCQLCTAQVSRLARWDTRRRLAFLSLHDPLVHERYPQLTHEQMMREMVLVDRQGRFHFGAAALREVARRIPRLWPLVPWMYLPGTLWLWQWLYRQVAARRYRFNRDQCDEGTCHLHGR
jgi:predicted DCC family thiol-disulfide oxidoreductase YuxK